MKGVKSINLSNCLELSDHAGKILLQTLYYTTERISFYLAEGFAQKCHKVLSIERQIGVESLNLSNCMISDAPLTAWAVS